METGGLVRSGVYRWSRNPQNVGWGFALLGVALIGRSVAALVPVALFWVFLHIYIVTVEEAHLQRVFGEEYQRYLSGTPRYLGLRKE